MSGLQGVRERGASARVRRPGRVASCLAGLALALAACAGSEGDAPRATRPELALERAWQLGDDRHAGGLAVPDGLAPWSYNTPDWAIESDVEGFADRRVLALESDAMKVLEVPLDAAHREFNRVSFEIQSSQNLSIGAELASEGRLLTRTPYRMVMGDHFVQRVTIEIPGARCMPFEADALILRVGGGDRRIRLGALRLEQRPWETWAAALSAPGTRASVGEVAREASALATDNSLTTRFVVPPDGRLAFHCAPAPGIAAPDARAKVFVRVEAGDAVLEEGLELDKSSGPSFAWQFVELDLAAFAGRDARVEFRLRAQGDRRDYAVVTRPTVYSPEPEPRAVLLVTSDTHRADHVFTLGAGVDVDTPALDALGERGVVFEDCYSSTNITLPSHVSLFTAVPPRDTGILDNVSRLVDDAPTLADAFCEAGWATLASVSSAHMRDDWSGLGQGFDALAAPTIVTRDGADSTAVLEALLAEVPDRSVFVWLHLFDAHRPYDDENRFLPRYWPEGRDKLASGSRSYPPEVLNHELDVVVSSDYMDASYKAEVTYVDWTLERVFGHPRLRGAWIGVTADHGESLGEHEVWWNHEGLFPQNLHVPLILAGPSVPSGRRVSGPVQHLDLGRTLLDLAGLEDVRFPGETLLRHLEHEPPADAPRFAISHHAVAASVRLEDWHCILQLGTWKVRGSQEVREAHSVELYDLGPDGDPLRDVAEDHVELAGELRGLILDWLERREATDWRDERSEVDVRRVTEVRALGYAGEATADDWSWIDPDCACEHCARYR